MGWGDEVQLKLNGGQGEGVLNGAQGLVRLYSVVGKSSSVCGCRCVCECVMCKQTEIEIEQVERVADCRI